MIETLSSMATCTILGEAYALAAGRFPETVRIETTNACNARCVICPHNRMGRQVCSMDQGLYVRIIDECAAAGCREVHLHNFGEPLLDKRLEERVRLAKQQGIRKVKIFTNGSLLSPARSEQLIDAGLDEIKISFDGATREEFEQIRVPLGFERIVTNIEELVALRDRKGSSMTIAVACCSTSDKRGTMERLEGIVDRFCFGKVHNWAGEDGPAPRWSIRKPCSRLWRTLTILADGRVALCCLDYDGQMILGRLDSRTTIREVWNGPAYQAVRRLHRQGRQGEIDLCRNCSKAFW